MADADFPDTAAATATDTVTATVGSRLRAAREQAGLSVAQASAATRVQVAVVRDLEADRFGSSGGSVYARGHVRALARAAGTDPCPLVAMLDVQTNAAPGLVSRPQPLPLPHAASGALLGLPVAAPPERRRPRWLAASLVGLVVLVALLVVGVLSDEPARRSEALSPPAAAPPSPTPAARLPAAPPGRPPTPAGAALVLQASGPSWLSIGGAGERTLFEGTVQSGWSQRFADPTQVRVRVGNAAAVRASCGGRPAEVLGAQGEVVTVACAAGGLQRP